MILLAHDDCETVKDGLLFQTEHWWFLVHTFTVSWLGPFGMIDKKTTHVPIKEPTTGGMRRCPLLARRPPLLMARQGLMGTSSGDVSRTGGGPRPMDADGYIRIKGAPRTSSFAAARIFPLSS